MMLIWVKSDLVYLFYYLGSKLIKFMEIQAGIDEIHLSTLYEKFNNIQSITLIDLCCTWLAVYIGLIKAWKWWKLIYAPKRISN